MTDEQVFSVIKEAIRSETGDMTTDITLKTTALDVSGWDSLAHGRIVMMIEVALSVRIDVDATYRAANVGDLLAIVRQAADQ